MYKIVNVTTFFFHYFKNIELLFVENWPKLFGPEQNYVGKWRGQFCRSQFSNAKNLFSKLSKRLVN